MTYRIGNSPPIPPRGDPVSVYGLGPRIQQFIGQHPQCWVGVGYWQAAVVGRVADGSWMG